MYHIAIPGNDLEEDAVRIIGLFCSFCVIITNLNLASQVLEWKGNSRKT